jgi:hypothetical protein
VPTIQGIKIKLDLGRPITRPKMINADKAYDSIECRDYNRMIGIISNILVNKRIRTNNKLDWKSSIIKDE